MHQAQVGNFFERRVKRCFCDGFGKSNHDEYNSKAIPTRPQPSELRNSCHQLLTMGPDRASGIDALRLEQELAELTHRTMTS